MQPPSAAVASANKFPNARIVLGLIRQITPALTRRRKSLRQIHGTAMDEIGARGPAAATHLLGACQSGAARAVRAIVSLAERIQPNLVSVSARLASLPGKSGAFLLGIAAPILARHRSNRNVQGFIKGAYAAAIGTILGASFLLGRIAIGGWFTVLICTAALAVLFRWKVSNPLLITAAPSPASSPSLLHPAWVTVK
jgi:hypothetical protein